MNLPGYDAWKLAYPPHYDHETEEEEEEANEPVDGLVQCLECGHIWDADQDIECEKCGSDSITGIAED
jgi:uncharacterized paraquat-inducible protein A